MLLIFFCFVEYYENMHNSEKTNIKKKNYKKIINHYRLLLYF